MKLLIRFLAVPALFIGIILFFPYWIITGKDLATKWIEWFEEKLKSND